MVTTRNGGANKRSASISPPSSPASAPTPKKLFLESSDGGQDAEEFVLVDGSDEHPGSSAEDSQGNEDESSSLSVLSDEDNVGSTDDAASDNKGKKAGGKRATPGQSVGGVDLDSLDDDVFTSTTSRVRRGNNANAPRGGAKAVRGKSKENIAPVPTGPVQAVVASGNASAGGTPPIPATPVAGLQTQGLAPPPGLVLGSPFAPAARLATVPEVSNSKSTPATNTAEGVALTNGTPAAATATASAAVDTAVSGEPQVAQSVEQVAAGDAGAPQVNSQQNAVGDAGTQQGDSQQPAANAAGAQASVAAPGEGAAPSVAPTGAEAAPPPGPPFIRPDGVQFTNQMKSRLYRLSVHTDPDEGIAYIGKQPKQTEWSANRVKESRLVPKGKITKLKLWVIGALTWNGMLPNMDGHYPTRPRVSVKPLRDEDLMLFRKIVSDKSASAKPVDTSNIGSVSAHADVSTRARGADSARASMFPRLYDAQQKFMHDKASMRVLRPADFLRGDIVLLEVSVGRYWDETANGRVTNWNSNRVYFNFESLSLLVAGNDEVDEGLLEFEAGNHTVTEYI